MRGISLAGMLLVAMTLLPAAMQAQGVRIRGTVRDTTGAPVAGAEVLIARRSAVTSATGTFLVDSVSPGRYTLTVRSVGMVPVRELLQVPATGLSGLDYRLRPAGMILPTVEVRAERPGIYGTIVLLGQLPAPGARVQLVGPDGRVAMSDSAGRFAFQGLRQGSYLVWVTHPGYTERRISVMLARDQGRELAVSLFPSTRIVSRGDIGAMDDLTKRLSFGLARERMTREDLQKRGESNICDLPQLRPVVGLGNATIVIVLNGTTVYRDMPAYSLCSWRADEVEMVEFATHICNDRTGTVAEALGVWCSGGAGRRTPPPRSIMGGMAGAGARSPSGGGFVIIWERR